MTQTVLIVEDDRQIAGWITRYLERAGLATRVTHDGRTGLELARETAPDLIVLDLMLPGLDGREVCRLLRRESGVPIIMVTAMGMPPDRIAGLDLGADDYISKPFDPDELVARVRSVLRRSAGRAQLVLTCGPLTLDEARQSVTLRGEPLPLSPAQRKVLGTLMRHCGQVLSREQLIAQSFGADFEASDRAVDTHIRRLRGIIHTEAYRPIQTVYGVGYRFQAEEA